ncbi:MAG TPA: rhodanese-like domain-containing protein [Gammaproteobacteria bacterium]|nr:rhodanese-like domain-containing protein [Gammaproteobacteria bacterium]
MRNFRRYFPTLRAAKRGGFGLVLFFTALCGMAQGETGDGAVWIDVRSEDEFETGHLEQAINIRYAEIGDKIAAVTQDKNADIHLYCASGHRASIAKDILVKMGYTRVTNAGGYKDLIKTDAQTHALPSRAPAPAFP